MLPVRGKIDRAAKDIQNTAINFLSLQFAKLVIQLLRITVTQIGYCADSHLPQILRYFCTHTGYCR